MHRQLGAPVWRRQLDADDGSSTVLIHAAFVM